MAEEDEEKTAFITSQGIFFNLKMSFGLKNVGATYQRLVDKTLQKQIGRNLEVYIDDLVIKSRTKQEIKKDVEETFKTPREINMKLNPKKCTFRIEEGMFLGYKVNTKGIKVCPDKVESVLGLPSPKCLKHVQKLNGKLESLNRFLAKSAEKSLLFFKTLKKCAKKSDFQWTAEAEAAFKQMIDTLYSIEESNIKTLSLDELRSPDFNLFSDQEYSEEEVVETRDKTMEQYMSKTRADYGSGVARPKIKDKDNFKLKCQFLKEPRTTLLAVRIMKMRTNTLRKFLIVDLIHILNITIDQIMLRAFHMSLTVAVSRWLRNEPTGSITTWDGPHYIKDFPLKEEGKPSKKLTTRNLVDLFKEGDLEQQLRDSIKGTMRILHTKNEDMPEDIKVPLILRRPFLSIARAKIDVYERKITLRIGEERIIFKSVKPASSLIKRVYMLSLRKRTELDLEARLIGETLVINTSLYPLNGDYIEFNNLNEPFELRRNQGDDLMPIIEEGEDLNERNINEYWWRIYKSRDLEVLES
ncbi:reverse transcriptase domain-containing protein [Tanacetum coccineum]